jgi:hypothetical protein
MIIVRLIGGLGNQMFQYAAGRALAFRLQVKLKLDVLDFPLYKRRSYSLSVFDLEESFATEKEVARLKFGRTSWFKKFHVRKGGKEALPAASYIREKHYHFDPDILELPDGVYLDGYWQSEAYFREIEDIVRQDFTIRIPPSDENRRLAERIRSVESVSLHIRRGDYVSDPTTNAYHGVLDPEYYQRAMDLIRSRVADAHFFVFSDDPDWAKTNLPDRNSLMVVNINREACAYEDFRLMSFCKNHIIANSSFSWWGAWLSQNQEKIVIAPRRWFQDLSVKTTDLIPTSWLRI